MNSLKIRRLQPGDSLDELTALVHRAFAPLGREGLRCTGVDQPVETTRQRVGRGDCFVACYGGRLVGTMTMEAPDRQSDCPWFRRTDVATLHQLAVEPCSQGCGCGRALIRHAEQWTQARGHAELALETPTRATELRAFYASQGFRTVGHWHKAGKDYESVVLSKAIAVPPRCIDPWLAPHRLMGCGSLGPR
ncbi:GNAT family N-acetyltransferase [Aquabacterium sp.]|uniref:GNAT family N-acetyltransferase n=1 Tax=Aquabacterium sp. TaxID=1872578 RepID=UPI00378471CB